MATRSGYDAATVRLLDRVAGSCYRVHQALPRLRHVTIEVTRRCPLRCAHCYASEVLTSRELTFLELVALAFQIRVQFGRSVSVALTGGEPLLRPALPLLVRFLSVLGLPATLATSGVLLDREGARKLAPWLAAVAVGIDGLRPAHERLRGAGTFRPALRAVRRFVEAGGPRVAVKTAVSPLNLADLPRLHRIVRRLGADEWHLFPVEPLGRAAADPGLRLSPARHALLLAFYDRVKADPTLAVRFGEQPDGLRRLPAAVAERTLRCGAGVGALAVLADGSVVRCAQCPEPVEGNVRERSLREIWRTGFRDCRRPGHRRCGAHLPLPG